MRIFCLILIFVLSSCATRREPSPEAPPAPPAPELPAQRETVAVAGLLESARSDASSGRLVQAAASLERALRIEPRNPRLWHELARVRLRQGDTDQAASLAQRSNSFAGSDAALRAANQNIIEQARTRR
jgi:Tfp pilus assembly protein PilF